MQLINRLFSALAAAAMLAGPAFAAGTLPLAMVQQVDINGKPLANCQVSFFVAGTVASPQNSYSDFGLSQNPNSVLSCDQAGRIPMFWLADGLVHVRLTDASGSPILDTTMQVLGPSSGGGGGGGTVDPTTIATTGSLTWRLDKDPLAGWVRINGLTIGNTTSGGTERANADTQALFVYIWTKFSQPSGNVICPVIGGLGASALADFNANKQITLEDGRARSVIAMDDMGNSALGGFTGVTFTKGNATTAGAVGGANSTMLVTLNLPPYTPAGSVGTSISGGLGLILGGCCVQVGGSSQGGGTSGTLSASSSFTGTPQGGASTPFPSVPSALLGTLFWKL